MKKTTQHIVRVFDVSPADASVYGITRIDCDRFRFQSVSDSMMEALDSLLLAGHKVARDGSVEFMPRQAAAAGYKSVRLRKAIRAIERRKGRDGRRSLVQKLSSDHVRGKIVVRKPGQPTRLLAGVVRKATQESGFGLGNIAEYAERAMVRS